MKNLLLFFLLLPQLLVAQTSYFSGKIVYDYQFLNPDSGEDITEKMSSIYGSEQHYYIHHDSYKAFDEKNNFGQLYNGSDNKYYYLNPNTKDVMEIEASIQTSEIASISHTDKTASILGRNCKQLIIRTNTEETVYFYSDEIKVNPSNFSGHKLGDWSEYLKASNGSLPLKYIVKTENFTWVSTAVSVEEMDLTKDDFDPNSVIK
jgi:hypothetical protein